MHWEKATIVPADKARAWFFDVQEDDHASPRHRAIDPGPKSPGDGRKILSKTPTRYETEDTWTRNGRRMSMRFVATLEGDAIVMRGEGSGLRSESRTTFTPTATGCRIAMDSTIRGEKLLMRLMMPLFAGKMAKTIAQDMDIHVLDMEDQWRARPW